MHSGLAYPLHYRWMSATATVLTLGCVRSRLSYATVTLVVVAELAIKSTWQTGRDFIECLQNVNRPTDTQRERWRDGETAGERKRRINRRKRSDEKATGVTVGSASGAEASKMRPEFIDYFWRGLTAPENKTQCI